MEAELCDFVHGVYFMVNLLCECSDDLALKQKVLVVLCLSQSEGYMLTHVASMLVVFVGGADVAGLMVSQGHAVRLSDPQPQPSRYTILRTCLAYLHE